MKDLNRDYEAWAKMHIGEWTGMYDCKGRKVMYGDKLKFDPSEWGGEHSFLALYDPRDGIAHASDIGEWCEVVDE